MCQIGKRLLDQKKVTCYRVYSKGRSYYRSMRMPKLGILTDCNINFNRSEPFHAFRTKEDVENWKERVSRVSAGGTIYKCELSGIIRTGRWSDRRSVKTVTGTKLKILKKVGTIRVFHHMGFCEKRLYWIRPIKCLSKRKPKQKKPAKVEYPGHDSDDAGQGMRYSDMCGQRYGE